MYNSSGVPYGHYDPSLQSTYYNATDTTWLSTFQKNVNETGTAEINNNSVAWLYSGLPGPYDGEYFGKLSDYKDGEVTVINGTDNSGVNNNTVVLEVQIEVDNWLGASEAYIDNITLNGKTIINVGSPSVIIIKPEAKTYGICKVPLEISAKDVFGIKSIEYNLWKTSEGFLYAENKTYTGPTTLSSLTAGEYTVYTWTENNLDLTTNVIRSFTVGSSSINVRIHPETLNIKSNGRWVTVKITLPQGISSSEVNTGSIKLWLCDDSIEPVWDRTSNDTIMLKIDRSTIQSLVSGNGNITIRLTGILPTGQPFEGTDTLRVINPGNGHNVNANNQNSNSNHLNNGKGNGLGKGKNK
jgi:hypothetical protein